MVKTTKMTKWLPVNSMILVRKDDDKAVTTGGILLPDQSKIPVLTCRVLAIGPAVDKEHCPVHELDKILVRPSSAIPLSYDADNKLYIIKAIDILAYEESCQ